jgi:hypothetical protein
MSLTSKNAMNGQELLVGQGLQHYSLRFIALSFCLSPSEDNAFNILRQVNKVKKGHFLLSDIRYFVQICLGYMFAP